MSISKRTRLIAGWCVAIAINAAAVVSGIYALFFAPPEQRTFAWQGLVMVFVVAALVIFPQWGRPHVARTPRG